MPRKASQGPAKAVVRIDVMVNNMCTRGEIQETLEKDLADPESLISRYLKEKFGYVPHGTDLLKKWHDVAIRSVASWRWITRWKNSQEANDAAEG